MFIVGGTQLINLFASFADFAYMKQVVNKRTTFLLLFVSKSMEKYALLQYVVFLFKFVLITRVFLVIKHKRDSFTLLHVPNVS